MPVMTYFMAPAEMGVLGLISVTAAMLTPLFSLNLTDGPAIHLVRERSPERLRDLYNAIFNGVVLSSVLFSAVALLVIWRWWNGSLVFALLVACLILSGTGYKLVSYILAVFQKTSVLVGNTLIRDGIATVLGLALVIAGASYYGMVFAAVAGNLLAGLLVYRLTRRDLPYRAALDWGLLGRMLGTALPLLPVFFFSWLIQSSDSYFLAYYFDQAVVGKYSVVYGLTSVILSLTAALNFFWFPVSARLWTERRETYRKVFSRLFLGFCAALFLAVVLFELNARLLLGLFARRAEYQDAHVIMGTIAFAFSMQVLITLLTAPLYSNLNVRAIFCSYLAGGLANLALNLLLIPSTGIVGAAISTAASYLLIVLMMGVFNYRLASFDFIDRRIFPVAAVFLAAWGGALWLGGRLGVLSVLGADIALLASAGGLLLFGVMTRDERISLAALVRQALGRKAANG